MRRRSHPQLRRSRARVCVERSRFAPKVLKIAITANGQISADGRPTTLDALIPVLRELAKNKGGVWYYREAPQADPHPNAMKVLSAIVDENLPIRLSTKPDYSDTVDDKGRSVPRQ
jgi:biopolymer transport protein ExbD